MSRYIKLEDVIHNLNMEVTGRIEYTETMKVNLFCAIDKIPTIEVSEDAISREWVLEEFQKGKEMIAKSECFAELMWLVKHAPSVIPTQNNAIQRVESVESVEKAKEGEGEWLLEEYPDGYYHSECSICQHWFIEDAFLKPYKYCPNCGSRKKGVE